MPELPEVETIRQGLEARIQGKLIDSIEVRYKGSWAKGDPQTAVDAAITAVKRQGKLLVFDLDNGYSLTIHLKMTGQLIWQAPRGEEVMGGHPAASYLMELPHKHTHVIFNFKDGSRLYFNDQRKFGRISLMPTAEVAQTAFIQNLGPEPLSDSFTEDYLHEALNRRGKQLIKAFLLDQTNIAGLGNIYADESLFLAGILPTRQAGSLSPDEAHRLYEAIPQVLEDALRHGGSSRRDYVNAVGEKGTFLNVAKVYQRAGQPCMNCGTAIAKTVVGGRSTHYCPFCQK